MSFVFVFVFRLCIRLDHKFSRRLAKTFSQEVFKASSRRLTKTSSKHLQDVLKTYHQVKLFLLTHLRDLFTFLRPTVKTVSTEGFA